MPLSNPPELRVNPEPDKDPDEIVKLLAVQLDAVNCWEMDCPAVYGPRLPGVMAHVFIVYAALPSVSVYPVPPAAAYNVSLVTTATGAL